MLETETLTWAGKAVEATLSNITSHPWRPRILFQEDVLLIRLAGEEPLAAAGMIVTAHGITPASEAR